MLPVKKVSKNKKRQRRSHQALNPVNYSICPKCNTSKLPHAACDNCGYVKPSLTLDLEKE